MIVGLTGKSCTGKNEVADYLNKKGWLTLDTDIMSHKILDKKKDDIIKSFGSNYVNDDGKINRRELAKIVFADINEMKKLESIIYPELEKEIDEIIQNNSSKNIIINGANLYYSTIINKCEKILEIKASLLKRVLRAKHRDKISIKEILKRFNYQQKKSIYSFPHSADKQIINNSFSKKSLEKKIENLLTRWS